MRVIRAVAIASLVCAMSGVSAAAWAGNSCEASIKAPQDWQGYRLKWSAECEDGVAHGLGVLRAHYAGKWVKSYYGTLNQGHFDEGVVDTGQGYQAGRFEQDTYVNSADRNVTLHAFDVAANAASALSAFYKEQGNDPSADFYAKKAQQLREQMD